MRVKKSQLRKGQAQLPINYPPPDTSAVRGRSVGTLTVVELCRRLAHNELDVRDEAFALVPAVLSKIRIVSNDESGSMDYRRVALGLFFYLWHCDEPVPQLECADRIASLVELTPDGTHREAWVRAMWSTLASRWVDIDRHRLDKYLALARRLLCAWLRVLQDVNDIAREGAAMVESLRPSVGLQMHVVDVMLDEMLRSGLGASPDACGAVFQAVPLPLASRVDGVVKRLLDFFIAPVAAGRLGREIGPEGEAAVLRRWAEATGVASIDPRTGRHARPLLVESAALLNQRRQRGGSLPPPLLPWSARDVSSLAQREIEEQLRVGVATRKLKGAVARVKRVARREAGVGVRKRPLPRNTKRKKVVKLTAADLIEE